MVKRISCENPNRIYMNFLGFYLVFDTSYPKGRQYVGWHRR
jgi:hypothetical protein